MSRKRYLDKVSTEKDKLAHIEKDIACENRQINLLKKSIAMIEDKANKGDFEASKDLIRLRKELRYSFAQLRVLSIRHSKAIKLLNVYKENY